MALYEELGETKYDGLFAGTQVDVVPTGVTLAGGQGVLRRGSVLGRVEADGTFKLVNKTATDGSQKASVVLATETDTGESGANAACYQTGVYRKAALIFAEGDSFADHADELRHYNIFAKEEIE